MQCVWEKGSISESGTRERRVRAICNFLPGGGCALCKVWHCGLESLYVHGGSRMWLAARSTWLALGELFLCFAELFLCSSALTQTPEVYQLQDVTKLARNGGLHTSQSGNAEPNHRRT